ncbi:MAG: acyl-CoA dehydrogenase [Alphaproteobacteria bacterium]|nr:acyl-CoA dehydrogenase [Alphaproteobacteria bacterium]
MFRKDSDDEARFRAEVRAWVEANAPAALRGSSRRPNPSETRAWHRALYERGWSAPHWPREYGGMGATIYQQVILAEEIARVGAPALHPLGPHFLAPALMAYGTDAQKQRHLPPILTGDVVWAQGYSEPNAGSDLASLRTRADLVGDHFVVTGQKIWTSWAHECDWMFALVRTDPDAKPKQAGISFLLIDLESPGLTIRPIETIAGDDELAEVFLDNVRVPRENLVGPLHGGWKVANHVLGFERVTSANPYRCFMVLADIKRLARANGLLDDAGFRDRLVEIELDVIAHAAIFNHLIELAAAGKPLGADASIIMIVGTEALQRLCDLLVEAAGPAAAQRGPVATPDGPVEVATAFLYHRHATIYGGSNEIQRNVVAKRVLGMN